MDFSGSIKQAIEIVKLNGKVAEKVSKDKIAYLNFKEDTTYGIITVEVDPRQAQDLIYILSTSPGSLFITLRHPNDRLLKTIPVSTIDHVLGKVRPKVKPRPRAPASIPAPAPRKKKRKKKFVPI